MDKKMYENKKLVALLAICLLMLSVFACSKEEALIDERLLTFNNNISEASKLSLNDGVQIIDKTVTAGDIEITLEQAITIKNGIGVILAIKLPDGLYEELTSTNNYQLFEEANALIDGKDYRYGWSGRWMEFDIYEGKENTVYLAMGQRFEFATFDKGETITLELSEINSRFAELEDDFPVTISWELENVLSDIVYERQEGGNEWYVQ